MIKEVYTHLQTSIATQIEWSDGVYALAGEKEGSPVDQPFLRNSSR
jgi:hypothetical protein